eukprot:scaffold22061_cov140-Isochrysis_galbana.AAC.1
MSMRTRPRTRPWIGGRVPGHVRGHEDTSQDTSVGMWTRSQDIHVRVTSQDVSGSCSRTPPKTCPSNVRDTSKPTAYRTQSRSSHSNTGLPAARYIPVGSSDGRLGDS